PEHAVTKNDPPGYAGRPPRCLLPRKPMPVVLLVLVALLAAAPARAGDDDYGRSLGKQQLDVWDRLKGIDRSMQHDADHPDRMGEDPGDDDEDDVGDDVGAKAPARRTAPGAPAVPPAPSRMPAPSAAGRPGTPPARPNLLESPIGRSPLAPEPPPPPDDQ